MAINGTDTAPRPDLKVGLQHVAPGHTTMDKTSAYLAAKRPAETTAPKREYSAEC
jgi:hypothetical protein